MKKKSSKSYILNLPKTYNFFYQKPTKVFDIYKNQIQEQELHDFLGLDFSMHGLYKDSNGNEPAYPRYYRQAEERLKREQRKLSLMQKGSKNRSKQRIKVANLHEKVANQRKV